MKVLVSQSLKRRAYRKIRYHVLLLTAKPIFIKQRSSHEPNLQVRVQISLV